MLRRGHRRSPTWLNGHADLSGEMAMRIEKAFGVSMDTLLRMQLAYDIARTRQNGIRSPIPVISRFLGIVIVMLYRDHEPPHFHATYGEVEIMIGITDGLVTSRFPQRALVHVLE